MFIEFLGLPGVGKTRLTTGILERLAAQGIPALSLTEAGHTRAAQTWLGRVGVRLAPSPALRRALTWRLFYAAALLGRLRFYARRREWVQPLLRAQARRPIPPAHRRLIVDHFWRLLGYYQVLLPLAAPLVAPVLVDDWFAHRTTHLFVSESERPTPEQVAAYLDGAPPAAVVIVVRAAEPLCVERIRARGLRGRLAGKSPAELAQFVANAAVAVDLTAAYLQAHHRPLIEIANSGDLTATCDDLTARLLALIPRQVQ